MPIDGRTKIYGIIGNPVSHSLSPAMHNGAFAHLGENRAYLPFTVTDIGSAIQGLRGLQIHGVSVTIPHKEAVMAELDEIDPVARKIGAVNTVVCNFTGSKAHLVGYNTDWLGAIRPLKKVQKLAGAKVIILGAGGSARAIGFGLLEEGATITLCSRTESRGRKLAAELGCNWLALGDKEQLYGDVLINATSVGMAPQHESSPVPPEVVGRFTVIMDIVYAPLTTLFLSQAQQAGCITVNGLEMLLYQGVAQFELWTSLQAPVEVMRAILLEAVQRRG